MRRSDCYNAWRSSAHAPDYPSAQIMSLTSEIRKTLSFQSILVIRHFSVRKARASVSRRRGDDFEHDQRSCRQSRDSERGASWQRSYFTIWQPGRVNCIDGFEVLDVGHQQSDFDNV